MRTSSSVLLFSLWLVTACLVAGGIATFAGMPSLWGNSARFLEYALPVPLGWGLLHWPGLFVFGGLVKAASTNPARWLAVLRDCSLGTLGGLLFAYLMVPEVRGFPLLMYLTVDAVLGLWVSTMMTMPADATPPSPRARIMMLSIPGALVVGAVLLWPFVGDRYRVSMTDTTVRGRVETLRVWAVRRRGGSDRAAECEGLLTIADQYRNRFTQRGSGLPMDGTIYLFENADALRRRSASSAWVTYSWRSGQPDFCSASR